MRALTLTAAVAAVAFGLAACGGGGKKEGAAAGGPPLKTFAVGETDFKLSPSTFSVSKSGAYAFHAVNNGQVTHSLEIEGNGVEQKLASELQPGASGDLTVALTPGTYEIYCPVDGHKDMGMKGEITIGGGSSAPPQTTQSTGGSGGGY
jgi:uncharacterized cupredoxin-like copper-binding protein